MTSFVYILGCRTKDRCLTYVGWTTNVDRRLVQHNTGIGARTTRGRAWVLLHTEQFRTRRQAMSREWYLKRDRKFRKSLAQGILLLSSPRKRGPSSSATRAKLDPRFRGDDSRVRRACGS